MVAVAENVLGIGLYSVEEAALYARMSRKLAHRWLFGSSNGEAAIKPELIDGKFISFLDFVQMMAIREIRQKKKEQIQLDQIRQLLAVAKEQGITHPFARKGIAFRWHNELGLQLPDGRLIEASGKHRGSGYLKEIVVLYKDDLGYDAEGLANLYHAWRWEGCVVDMNPRIRFGEPIVTSCGYSAQALFEAATDEGSVEAAARAYGVEKKEIEAACRYFDMLQGKACDSAAKNLVR